MAGTVMSLVKIDVFKDLIYVMAHMKFCPYFKSFWAIWKIFGVVDVHKFID
jgi:hypothetical protein